MSTYRAFGDEATRQALIADIREKGPIHQGWLTRASIEGDISAISETYGLHPALARILPALGAFGEAEDPAPFHEALLVAIPVGAETGALARQIVLLAWNDPVYGRRRAVGHGSILDACEDIIALVEKSATGLVDKMTWRAARAKLAGLRNDGAASEKTLDLVMSLGWDLDQAPGAAHDVVMAWTSAVNAEADASDEDRFSAEELATFEAEIDRVNDEAMESLSQRQSVESINIEDFLAEAEKIWAADPGRKALKLRSVAQRQRSNAKMAIWRAAIQQRALELAAKAFPEQPISLPGSNRGRSPDRQPS